MQWLCLEVGRGILLIGGLVLILVILLFLMLLVVAVVDHSFRDGGNSGRTNYIECQRKRGVSFEEERKWFVDGYLDWEVEGSSDV